MLRVLMLLLLLLILCQDLLALFVPLSMELCEKVYCSICWFTKIKIEPVATNFGRYRAHCYYREISLTQTEGYYRLIGDNLLWTHSGHIMEQT